MAAPTHPALQELDALLQSLPSLKPPGVNKKSVETATRICMDPQNLSVRNLESCKPSPPSNLTLAAQVEPYFVDVLLGNLRRSPESHKLGVLYIIDSIMRQWVVTGATHAGGVRKMTDNLPSIMNDYIPVVPEAQKVRLEKSIALLMIFLEP